MLVVETRAKDDTSKHVKWSCRCDCGRRRIARGEELRSGRVHSCGCDKVKRPYEDLTGQQFGKLTVLKRAGNSKCGHPQWLCRCECGNEKIVRGSHLRSGDTTSCRECYTPGLTHGHSQSRLHRVWAGMKARCYQKSHMNYHYYGGRGIEVCKEWRESFASFEKWAIENGYDFDAPQGKCTLDRIDNDGDYEPNNCRWVDMHVQAKNQRPRRKKKTA